MSRNQICLRCNQEAEDYWFSFGLPGAYCTNCMDNHVIPDHEFLSRLIDLVLQNFNNALLKQKEEWENAQQTRKGSD